MSDPSYIGDRLLLDSLPYIDTPIAEGADALVQQLIEEEMRNYAPQRDYLGHLPPVPTLEFPVCMHPHSSASTSDFFSGDYLSFPNEYSNPLTILLQL